MTSRYVTSARTRSDESPIVRAPADWARLFAFGAVQWPWLLKSLYGGSKAQKAALLAQLGLAEDALPHLGSWKADAGQLQLIADKIRECQPAMVVELGAGASSLVIARALHLLGASGRLISYDQHADFVVAVKNWLSDFGLSADIRHAPLVAQGGDWGSLWYDLQGLPEEIDMLVVDGPPWALGPTIREGAAALFSRITRGGIVILDDAARPGERLVARRWRQDWPDFDWSFVAGIKGTLIGVRRSDPR